METIHWNIKSCKNNEKATSLHIIKKKALEGNKKRQDQTDENENRNGWPYIAKTQRPLKMWQTKIEWRGMFMKVSLDKKVRSTGINVSICTSLDRKHSI